MTAEQILLVFFGLWLLVLTVFLYWLYTRISLFIKNTKEESLVSVIDKALSQEKKLTKDITRLGNEIKNLDQKSLGFIKKVGVVRFNPFSETGGDHSFCIAFLDGEADGIVLTGLHTRERTRIYMKPIKNGKSEYDLSKEENKAIAQAGK